MNALVFIKENIYHLKREYGICITVGRQSTTSNLKTGNKTISKSEFKIPRAIALPFNVRQMFAKMTQNRKEGYVQSDDRDVLIDKADVPTGRTIKENDYIIVRGNRADITKVEEYEFAYVLKVKHIDGMPML